MAHAEVRSTAFNLAFPERQRNSWSLFSRRGRSTGQSADIARPNEEDPEFKLPRRLNLVIVLFTNGLLQVSTKMSK